ncbi:unnamed protein product [Alopecurus aequalis]
MSETIESHHQSFVTFLKHGALLPARRCRRLFLELFALSGAVSAAFYFFKRLALATGAAVAADLYLSPRDMDMGGVFKFFETWPLSDHRRLLPLAYLVAGIAVGLVTHIATVSAAVVARRYESGPEEEGKVVVEEDDGEEEVVEEDDGEEEDEVEEDDGGEEGEKKEEQEHHTLISFLGTVKSNLARPAKIIASSCGLRAAMFILLGWGNQVHEGFLGRGEVIYPAVIACFLVEFVCAVAVVASVAEEPAGQSAVGRTCRVVRGKYKEFLLYRTGQGLIQQMFSVACALVAMVGLPQQLGAAVMCLLLGAKEVLSAANMTGYYACRDKEDRKQDKACHLD